MLPIQASTRATPYPLPFIFLKPKRGPAVLPFLPPIFYSTSWQDAGRTRCPASVLPFLPPTFYSTSWQGSGRTCPPSFPATHFLQHIVAGRCQDSGVLPFLPPIFTTHRGRSVAGCMVQDAQAEACSECVFREELNCRTHCTARALMRVPPELRFSKCQG